MTDSTQFDDFREWHKQHHDIFHWKINGGVIKIISLSIDLGGKEEARRLARALRYRKINASTNYRRLFMEDCEIGVFLQALKAVKLDWENGIKDRVAFLYFDGDKHITDQKPCVSSM